MKMTKIFLPIIIICCFFNSNAQRTRTTKPVAGLKLKAPKFTVTLGGYKDASLIEAKIADSIITLPIKVVDAKDISYSLSSYQFLYRKIVVSEDEATGKPYNTTSVKSSLFKISPLPALWLGVVRENLRPTEELMFFDIIVKDDKGNFMYAPNLKLTLK
jgi:hypothetical protein